LKYGISSKEIEDIKKKERAEKFGLNKLVVERNYDDSNDKKAQRAVRFGVNEG
jgi:hypothetical protein